MYTRRLRAKKLSLGPAEEQTLLGSAVATAVHGRTNYLLELIVEYFRSDGIKNMSRFAELLMRTLGELQVREEPTDEENEIIGRAAEELRKSHRKFRAAMTWLCSSKPSNPAARAGVKLLASGRWQAGRFPHIDKRSESFIRYFETHLRHFKIHLSLQDGRLLPSPRMVQYVDLFCAFVLDRCAGRKASEMPIKICPTCGKLFLSGRKQFCSKDCQWKHYWTPERRADDKWVKDLERFATKCKPEYGRSIEDLRQKLASPKTERRLLLIKEKAENEDWAGWPKIVNKIDAIEKLARKSRLLGRRPEQQHTA